MALLWQLEQSQWRPAAEINELQFCQLSQVVAHAARTVPFYRERCETLGLGGNRAVSPAEWREFPILSRRDVQLAGDSLHSTDKRPLHGRLGQVLTSGSTGQPIQGLTTDVTRAFWRAFTIRDHLWHRPTTQGRLAAIRDTTSVNARPPHGERLVDWGTATRGILKTGDGALLSIQSTVDEQVDWLRRIEPSYLLAYPTTVRALAQHAIEHQWRLPELVEVRTFGEVLEPECRRLCREAWAVRVVDLYSAAEVGYIALQCPQHEHYHVQSEGMLVEVVDEQGRPCAAGEVGRVLLTTLHNFAMPLLRYEIGDFAEVGETCPCGRGLPVLRRILGRQRNMMTLPDGSRRWPDLARGERPEQLPAVLQFQVIQRSVDELEVLIVRPAPITDEEAGRMTRYLRQTLGCEFRIRYTLVDSIPRSRSGKYEDFKSDVASE
jgi:phenylacetate-CoA ligase